MYTRVCTVSCHWNTFKLHSHTKLNLIIPTTTLPFSFTVKKQHQVNLKWLWYMLHVHLSFCSFLSLKYIQTTLPHETKPDHSNHHPAFQFHRYETAPDQSQMCIIHATCTPEFMQFLVNEIIQTTLPHLKVIRRGLYFSCFLDVEVL